MRRANQTTPASHESRVAAPLFIPLPRSFYKPSAKTVAPSLLGHWLVRNTSNGPVGGIIVETEGYLVDDPACHGYKGETKRNRAMYGPPGCAYVYFIYGNHYCFNAVCRQKGVAEAVLVRALEPIFGLERMRSSRSVVKPRELTNGPAKFCEALDIDRRLDAVDLCDAHSAVFIARNPDREEMLARLGPVRTTTRIGITKAAHLPLRFYLAGSEFVSRR